MCFKRLTIWVDEHHRNYSEASLPPFHSLVYVPASTDPVVTNCYLVGIAYNPLASFTVLEQLQPTVNLAVGIQDKLFSPNNNSKGNICPGILSEPSRGVL